MCREERNTESRGRPPATRDNRCRTRIWRRAKRDLDLLVMARPSLLLLAFLAADMLVRIADALALVGLGLAVGAQHRGDLPHLLPVGTGDADRGRLLAGDLDLARDRKGHVVAVAELQHQVLALHRGAIADTLDLEALGEALGDAGHHVVDGGAHRAPMGT